MRASPFFLLAREPLAEWLRHDLTFQLFLSRLQLALSAAQFLAHQPWEKEASVAIAAC